MFPPPPVSRASDSVNPQRYPTTSSNNPLRGRKRPEPLQLKGEKEAEVDEYSRDSKDNENDFFQNKNPVFLKSPPSPSNAPFQRDFSRQKLPSDFNQKRTSPEFNLQNSPPAFDRNGDTSGFDGQRSPSRFGNQRTSSDSEKIPSRLDHQRTPSDVNRERLPLNPSGEVPRSAFERQRVPPAFDRHRSPSTFQRQPTQSQNEDGELPEDVANKLAKAAANSERNFAKLSEEITNREASQSRDPKNPEQDLKSSKTQEHPEFVRPLRYSLEQVPTASLRYNSA